MGLAGGLIPTDPAQFDDRVAARIASLGFERLIVHFGAGHGLRAEDLGADACARLRATAETRGLAIEFSWTFGANLVRDDDAVERLAGAMRVARDLGARGVVGGVGTMGAASGYTPHPGNHTPETRSRLVGRLREVAARGADVGVPFVLEPHVATALDTPEGIRALVDEVGSPFVRVNIDPVNLVGDLPTLWDAAAHAERCVEAAGGRRGQRAREGPVRRGRAGRAPLGDGDRRRRVRRGRLRAALPRALPGSPALHRAPPGRPRAAREDGARRAAGGAALSR